MEDMWDFDMNDMWEYKKWLEEKTVEINTMTVAELEERKIELQKLDFFNRREISIINRRFNNLTKKDKDL